jgi:hypothetical protein
MYQHFRGLYFLRPTLPNLRAVTFQNTAICIIPAVMSHNINSKDTILKDHNLTVKLERYWLKAWAFVGGLADWAVLFAFKCQNWYEFSHCFNMASSSCFKFSGISPSHTHTYRPSINTQCSVMLVHFFHIVFQNTEDKCMQSNVNSNLEWFEMHA